MSPPDPRAVIAVGSVLDEAYQLTRLITEGGMGTVYEGVQIRLHRRVAVKVMAPELAENAEALARFRREVEVTSQLAHPHVIQLLDFGMAPSGQPYLVMEYLEGEDLERRLQRVGRLPLAAVVDIVKQIAAALTAIHAKGIVHRDLKPANVFLLTIEGAADFVKVVDFGISKVRTAKAKLTRASHMVGTPHFMSPEQATGRVDDVDHRSDQWALACIAWQLLSGKLPFAGPDVNSVLNQVVHHEPPPLEAARDVPPEVERTLRRAMAKDQTERFPTISAFERAVEAAAAPATAGPGAPAAAMPATRPPVQQHLHVRPAPTRLDPPPSRSTAPLLLVALLAFLGVVGAYGYYRVQNGLDLIPSGAREPAPKARPSKAPARSRSE